MINHKDMVQQLKNDPDLEKELNEQRKIAHHEVIETFHKVNWNYILNSIEPLIKNTLKHNLLHEEKERKDLTLYEEDFFTIIYCNELTHVCDWRTALKRDFELNKSITQKDDLLVSATQTFERKFLGKFFQQLRHQLAKKDYNSSFNLDKKEFYILLKFY